MAIDADLNAGLIAKMRRPPTQEISQEAEFYGPSDG